MDLSQAKPITTPMPKVPAGGQQDPKPAEPIVAPTPDVDNAPAPVVPEPAPAPAEPAPLPTEPLDLTPSVEKTGNGVFDQVGKLLTDKGVTGVDAAFKEIAETGVMSLGMQAKIVEALGEGVASLVVNQLQAEVSKIKDAKVQSTQQTLDYVTEKFGVDKAKGQDAWADVQKFVRDPSSGFSAADRTTLTQMVQAGGLQARMAVDTIHAKFMETQGFEQPADLIQGNTYAPSTFQPVSKGDYAAKLREVVEKHGYDSHQAQALRQQRLASMQRGY